MSEHKLGCEERPVRVAIVGSGPSGFYAAQALFKCKELVCQVDMFDRLPTPFGLVRGGVAPDHQRIKKVIKQYERIASTPGFRFFGNVKLGRDINVEDLVKHYDQIVYATGNESDRKMGLAGEDLDGVYSATEFVGWYNGHPDFQDRDFDLDNAKRVLVIGIGNVAIDVARILARSVDELLETDISDRAYQALRRSAVKEVLMLGRRGPAQSKFSPKEIRELGSLDSADLVIMAEQLELDPVSREWMEREPSRETEKNLDYLRELAEAGEGEKPRKIRLEFLASPIEFLGEDGKLTAARIERNVLYEDARGTPRPKGTGEVRVEPVDLVFKAVGYRGVPIRGVPFHNSWGIIPNLDGRVLDSDTDGQVVPNQYVVGWAKRGPSGLIGTNSPCSAKTVDKMLEDLEGKTAPDDPTRSPEAILSLLRERSVDFVSFEDWQRLDALEIARGKAKGKIREKFCSVEEMLAAIREARAKA